jgi:hypothetical protein
MAQPFTRLCVAAFCALALTSCFPHLKSAEEMNALPDAHLYYPGATVVSVIPKPQTPGTNAGALPGSVTTQFNPHASSADVLAWYRSQLKSRA